MDTSGRDLVTVRNTLHKRRIMLCGFVLFLAVLALYWPAAGFEFTTFDDPRYIAENAIIQDGVTPHGLRQAFRVFRNEYWIPVTWLSYMVDVEIFGTGPMGFHVTNVFLHGINTVLVFYLLYVMTARGGLSVLTAVLFAAHPQRVETVAWIVERKGLLALFFLLLSLFAYVQYCRSRKTAWYLAVPAAHALSLMAKPMFVTLPFLLLTLDYWPLQRFQTASEGEAITRFAGRRLFTEKIPVFFTGALFAVLTFVTQSPGRHAWDGHYALANNLGRAALSYFVYMRDLFWPTGLGVKFYDLTAPPPASLTVYASVFALVLVTGSVTWAGRRWSPPLAAGWWWYLIALVPVSGIVPVGIQWTADRFTYAPHVLLLAGLVWTLDRFIRHQAARRFLLVLALVLATGWSIAARRQLSYWEDAVTLASRSVEIAPGNVDAGLFKAGAYKEAQLDLAIEEYRRILAVREDVAPAHHRLALALASSGQADAALKHHEEALRLEPDSREYLLSYADALYESGKSAEAVKHYLKYLESGPPASVASYVHNQLGLTLRRSGHHAASVEEFRQALHLDSNNGLYHFNLAVSLSALGKRDEVAFHYEESLRIDPDDHRARLNLAEHYYGWGQTGSARQQYTQIARRLPGTAEELLALGRMAEMDGNREAALEHYRKGMTSEAVYPQVIARLEELSGTTSR